MEHEGLGPHEPSSVIFVIFSRSGAVWVIDVKDIENHTYKGHSVALGLLIC